MVRHGQVRRALLTVAAAVFAVSASAQTLGEAAKRAKEQRQENTTPPLVISKLPDTPADSGPVRLTEEVVRRYGDARRALADLRRADRGLHSRLLKAYRSVRHYDELEPLYGAEPDLVALLGSHRLTVAAYLQIEAAIWRGKDYAAYWRTLSMESLSKRDAENVEFVKSHMGVVDSVWQSCLSHEGGLGLVGLIPSYR